MISSGSDSVAVAKTKVVLGGRVSSKSSRLGVFESLSSIGPHADAVVVIQAQDAPSSYIAHRCSLGHQGKGLFPVLGDSVSVLVADSLPIQAVAFSLHGFF